MFEQLEACAEFDLTAPSLPPRNRLYALAPIGVGTPMVECMTSYVTRLAGEYDVSTSVLIRTEFTDVFDKAYMVDRGGTCAEHAARLNGHGSVACDFLRAIILLTGRDDLTWATLSLWQDVLACSKLLRRQRGWCPACFAEWRERGETLYEPLLWAMSSVKRCTYHARPLVEECPQCGAHIRYLAAQGQIGCCPRCDGWLGDEPGGEVLSSLPHPGEDADDQDRAVQMIGELLAVAPSLPFKPSRVDVIRNVRACIERVAYGNVRQFSRLIGLNGGSIYQTLQRTIRPNIDLLVLICCRTDMRLLDLFTKSDAQTPGDRSLEDTSLLEVRPTSGVRRERVAWVQVEDILQNASVEMPPPSLNEMYRRTGYHTTRLWRSFPQLCQAVKKRASEYRNVCTGNVPVDVKLTKRAFEEAAREDPPPTLRALIDRLPRRSRGYYEHNFPELCRIITKRHRDYRNPPLDEDAWRIPLEAVLLEDTPPPLTVVAKRFGRRPRFFYTRFPELAMAISARRREYVRVKRIMREESLKREVEQAVEVLTDQKIHPTIYRVRGMMSTKANSWKVGGLVKQVKQNHFDK